MLGKGSLAGDRVRSRTMVPNGESRSQSGSLSCRELVSIGSSVWGSGQTLGVLLASLPGWLPFTQFPTLTVPTFQQGGRLSLPFR